MKTRYKITAIAFSVLLGILFMPIIVSNLYCDYLTDSCSSRITGVGPGGIYLPAEWGTIDNCHRYNPDTENMDPCRIDIAQINWPFPPRILEHERECNEICLDDSVSNDTMKNDDWSKIEPFSYTEPEAIEERFQGITKSQIDDIQLAELGCKKIGNQTYCDIMVQEKIDYYLQQNQGELENEN